MDGQLPRQTEAEIVAQAAMENAQVADLEKMTDKEKAALLKALNRLKDTAKLGEWTERHMKLWKVLSDQSSSSSREYVPLKDQPRRPGSRF
jgi:hypothetical protein